MGGGWTPYNGEAYLDFPAVEAWCRALALALPQHVRLETVGHTRHGRPLLLLTLGDQRGGTDAAPALWVDGGTHAAEWTGVMAALFAVSRWVEALVAGDTAAPGWPGRHTIYVLPCMAPDGFQAMMEGAPYLRSTLRPPPEGTLRTGLDPKDMDGDGVVRWMRWRHPAGSWVEDPEVPLCMRPRTLDDAPSDAFFVCEEGELNRWDGVRWVVGPLEFGLDLNRNFPARWEPFRMFGMDGGAAPLSEPESRAVVDAVAARPNIGAALTYHTFTGALLTQPYRDPSPLPQADIERMEQLARGAVAGTGYRALRVHPDFVYDPSKPIVGVWADTLCTVFGVPGYTLELWDPFSFAGVPVEKPAEFFVRPDPAVVRKVIATFSQEPHQTCPWRPFQHPQLGAVELGGIDNMHTIRNPPLLQLPGECEKGYRVAERLRRALPEIAVRAALQTVSPGAVILTAVVENLGYLPTSALQHAENLGISPGIRLELELDPGLRLAQGEASCSVGHLDGWGSAGADRNAVDPSLQARGHRAVARWTITGSGALTLRWWSRQAGRGEARLRVG